MAGRSADRHANGAPETAPVIAAAAIALLLAAVNVIFGLLYRTDDERAADFQQILAWAGDWIRGSSVYRVEGSLTDYPPNALVTVAPLALMPCEQAAASWMVLHVILTAAMGVMTYRMVRGRRFALPLAALVLALPPFRTPMQFSVASFVLALAGFLVARDRPRLAGVAIGLSLMKPHIGGPMLLWALAARRWTTASIATGVSLALAAVYIARAGRWPHDVIADWMRAVARTQNRDDLVAGQTNLQPFISRLGWPEVSLQLLTAGVLCLALVWIWIRWRGDGGFDLRFVAAACLISLLSFRHLSYDLFLAVPAVAFALARNHAAARWLGALALALFIASPPSVWLHAVEPRFGATPFDWPAEHAYRIAAAALFLLVVASGSARTPSGRQLSSA